MTPVLEGWMTGWWKLKDFLEFSTPILGEDQPTQFDYHIFQLDGSTAN